MRNNQISKIKKYLIKAIIIFVFIFSNKNIIAQQLFVENGASISSIGKSNYESSYQISLGINYLHRKNYFITTNIGYISKGGKFYYTDENNKNKFTNNKYLTLSLLFNLSKQIDKSSIYLGVGPRYDVRVNRSNTSQELNWNKSSLLGLKIDTGFDYLFSHFIIGLNFSYLPSFTNYLKNSNAKDNTFTAGCRLGFNF